MHAGIRQRPVEFGLKNMLDAFHHEIHNRLRCVDDAVCICNIFGEPLKKLLIERVEEMLFLGEISTERCCLFDSDIETDPAVQETRRDSRRAA